jgi:hypothetical protein
MDHYTCMGLQVSGAISDTPPRVCICQLSARTHSFNTALLMHCEQLTHCPAVDCSEGVPLPAGAGTQAQVEALRGFVSWRHPEVTCHDLLPGCQQCYEDSAVQVRAAACCACTTSGAAAACDPYSPLSQPLLRIICNRHALRHPDTAPDAYNHWWYRVYAASAHHPLSHARYIAGGVPRTVSNACQHVPDRMPALRMAQSLDVAPPGAGAAVVARQPA